MYYILLIYYIYYVEMKYVKKIDLQRSDVSWLSKYICVSMSLEL